MDTHIYQGYSIPPWYDSLIAKLIIFADNREDAIARMYHALDETVIDGIETNLPLHKRLMQDAGLRQGAIDIHYLEKLLAAG